MQHIQDAAQRCTIIDRAPPATFGRGDKLRDQRLQRQPQLFADFSSRHATYEPASCRRASCVSGSYKQVVKMTFAKGASLTAPSGLFNASLEGNTRRAIDIREGDKLNEAALKALIRAAVGLNKG